MAVQTIHENRLMRYREEYLQKTDSILVSQFGFSFNKNYNKQEIVSPEEYKQQKERIMKRLDLNGSYVIVFMCCQHKIYPKRGSYLDHFCSKKYPNTRKEPGECWVFLEKGCFVCARVLKTPKCQIFCKNNKTLQMQAQEICRPLSNTQCHSFLSSQYLREWENAYKFLFELRLLSESHSLALLDGKKTKEQVLEEINILYLGKTKNIATEKEFYWP